MSEIDEQIDRLIHDAQHADSGSQFAATMQHLGMARELKDKRDRLLSQARALHAANPGARWPDPEDCEWTPQS